MIRIGKSKVDMQDGTLRLSAEISINNRWVSLWFAVDSSHERCMSIGRADAFVMALFPVAIQGNHHIVCEDPLSERLCYQLGEYLAPARAGHCGGPSRAHAPGRL